MGSVHMDGQDLDVELPVTVSDDGKKITAKASDITRVLGEMSRKAQSPTGSSSSPNQPRTSPIVVQPVITTKVTGSSPKEATPQSSPRLRGGYVGDTIETVTRTQSLNPLPTCPVGDRIRQQTVSGSQELVTFDPRAHNRNVENQMIQRQQLQAPILYPLPYQWPQPIFPPMYPQMVYRPHEGLVDRVINAVGALADDLLHPELRCPCGIRHSGWHAGCMHCS